MAAPNGLANGVNGHGTINGAIQSKRFSDIPGVIDVTVAEGDVVEQVEIDLVELADDPTELCILLENESVVKSTWMTIALAYAKQRKTALAIDILHKARDAFSRAGAEEKLSILSALFWLNLCMCREAPRLRPGKYPPHFSIWLSLIDLSQRVPLQTSRPRSSGSKLRLLISTMPPASVPPTPLYFSLVAYSTSSAPRPLPPQSRGPPIAPNVPMPYARPQNASMTPSVLTKART